MASCEYCWERKSEYMSPDDWTGYRTALRTAEAEGWPCQRTDEEGARLRAGQYWDAERKVDTRIAGASNGK